LRASRAGAKFTTLLTEGACQSSLREWSAAEQRAAERHGPGDRQVAEALLLCAGCPVQDLCAEWARLDKYSGLAAGQLWDDGKRMRWLPW